jgi:hypothetical protein
MMSKNKMECGGIIQIQYGNPPLEKVEPNKKQF